MADLGKLARVDARSVWAHEAHHFTPWLAENIGALGEVLSLDLEVEMREGAVGDFSVDIVARDGRGRTVIVENQLEATDHGHLGQLITYAAGRKASVVVWVSCEFREEHRQALDWLNGSGADTEYFGVVLELLKVDDSKPAVNLRLVASPNNWSRTTARSRGPTELTSKSLAYQTFFQKLIDDLREKYHFTNARAAQAQSWYQFSSGTTGFRYCASYAAKSRLRSELYIDVGDGDANERALKFLKESSSDIEAAFGEALEWEMLDTKRACRVACYRTAAIEDSEVKLDEHLKWTVERLLRFKKVFGPRLADAASATAQAPEAVDD